jgi:serine kinase of HPr protein (carbohydrate metabolism regulator)
MSPSFPSGEGVHATGVVVGEAGVLIFGPSGAGKSALALALMARARDSGLFAALVGDDRVWLSARSGRLVVAGAAHMAGRIERRGAGIIAAEWEPAAVVRLAVQLSGPDAACRRFPDLRKYYLLGGVETPRLEVDGRAAAADCALAVLERLGTMTKGSSERKRISLEQCAALHKNRQLGISPAAPDTQESRAG